MPSGIGRPGTVPLSPAEMQRHHSGQCQPSVSFPGYTVWIPGNSEGNRKAAPCVLLPSSSVGAWHTRGCPRAHAPGGGSAVCGLGTAWPVCVGASQVHVRRAPSGARGFGRQGKRLHLHRACGLESHPVHRRLGAGQPHGHRQSPRIKKEQAAGGSTGPRRLSITEARLRLRASLCGPLGLGSVPCPWSVPSLPGGRGLGCSLFFFQILVSGPCSPRRCQGSRLACPPRAGGHDS